MLDHYYRLSVADADRWFYSGTSFAQCALETCALAHHWGAHTSLSNVGVALVSLPTLLHLTNKPHHDAAACMLSGFCTTLNEWWTMLLLVYSKHLCSPLGVVRSSHHSDWLGDRCRSMPSAGVHVFLARFSVLPIHFFTFFGAEHSTLAFPKSCPIPIQAIAGVVSVSVGHCHPVVMASIREQ